MTLLLHCVVTDMTLLLNDLTLLLLNIATET